MRLLAVLFWSGLCWGQILIIIVPQVSPSPLPANTTLYSVSARSSPSETRNRTISAAQILSIASTAEISWVDPALSGQVLQKENAHPVLSRALTVIKYSSGGVGVAGASLAAFKASSPNTGNANTWAIISAVGGATLAGLAFGENQILSAQANTATTTTNVQNALITDMQDLYSVPSGGAAKSIMFLGTGAPKTASGVVP